jgi:hypothetical protein
MLKILNIVNGDVAAGIMKKAHINGDFLPWRDFLHEGPVPKRFSLSQLSKIRAHFIHTKGFGSIEKLEKEFKERDNQLQNYYKYIKIVLWFEHDLYDQLQLIQVLAWFHKNNKENITITLICTNSYLGECTAQEIAKLSRYEQTVTQNHLELATRAWLAFSESTPIPWFKLFQEETSLFPFLKESIRRMLEEYPNTKNGLSRSAHQALMIISKGEKRPKDIFENCQKYEKQKFMGNIIFWKILDDFVEHNLISSKENGQRLQITLLGQQVLNGEINWLHIKTIKRWIGGVNISKDNLWCWDIKKKNIKRYYYSVALSSLLDVK